MLQPPRQSCSNATGIVIVVAALMTVGMVMVASAGARVDRAIVGWRFWETAFGRQAIFTIVGFIVLLIVSNGGHRYFVWRVGRTWQPAAALYALTALCLAAALFPGVGTARKGARRWLSVGPAELGLSFQPSELAKLGLVIFLAAFLAGRWRDVRSFRRGTLPACGLVGLFVALVGIEDFGTAALLGGVGAAMLLVGGVRRSHLAMLGLPGIAAMGYLIYREPYRMERLTTFLDIWKDPRGAGYHPIQSLVTIASGGLTGRGLGAGVQKYGYLPEARSDFIFSVICEEAGLLGAAVVIGLFVVLLWLGWRAVTSEVSPFARLLAFGVTTLITLQAVINIAVVTVCAPTKGISLPFVSAGGSGVIFLGFAAGLLVSAARESEEEWSPADQPLPELEDVVTT